MKKLTPEEIEEISKFLEQLGPLLDVEEEEEEVNSIDNAD